MAEKAISDIIQLPNPNNAIKEVVITLFLQNPIKKLEDFETFYDQNLTNYFDKIDKIHEVSYEFDSNNVNKSNPKLSGYKLYKVDNDSTVSLLQISNEVSRQYISFHCLQYDRWLSYRRDFEKVIKAFDQWLENKVVAFSLHYIDVLQSIEDSIPLDLIFDKNSELLPRSIFNSQKSHLVFNTEKDSTNTKYQHYDRVEIKVENATAYISHNSIIPVGVHDTFRDFIKCSTCSDKLDWAHQQNKTLLKGILSKDVQTKIGLI